MSTVIPPDAAPAGTELTWPAAWARAVLGPAGVSREAVRRLLFMVPSYLFISAVTAVAVMMGQAPADACVWVFVYAALGQLVFYAGLRAGLAQHHRDPLCVFPQLCFQLTVVVLAYALIPLSRSLVVQWVCLLILFDMRRLSGRQVLLAALLAYGMLTLTMLLLRQQGPGHIDMVGEAVNIAMASVTLGSLLVVTRVGRRVHEQRKAQQARLADTVAKLDELATRDGLTGVYNRRCVQGLVEDELRRQARGKRAFCVALLDIDHFKQVNDRHGHAVGDAVLREVARLLSEALPPPHALGRWGGEEFLVLMPECTAGQAQALLDAAAQAVRSHDWGQHAPGLRVSFSGGISAYLPAIGAQAPHAEVALAAPVALPCAKLVERADRALYAAKATGRDRICQA